MSIYYKIGGCILIVFAFVFGGIVIEAYSNGYDFGVKSYSKKGGALCNPLVASFLAEDKKKVLVEQIYQSEAEKMDNSKKRLKKSADLSFIDGIKFEISMEGGKKGMSDWLNHCYGV